MARAVLMREIVAWALLLCCFLAAYGCSVREPRADAQTYERSKYEALANPQCVAFRTQIEKSPFYQAAISRFGAPTGIGCRNQNAGQELSYVFQQNAKFEARIQPQVEFEEQRLILAGLSTEEGLDLLRAAEQNWFRNKGCGIAWDSAPETSGTRPNYEHIYWGKVCNCQGRLVYQHEQVVGLIFSSAC